MLVAIIFFFLIFLLPYLLYFKKRLNQSNDKNLFLREHLYQSTLWIFLLVLIPLLVANSFSEESSNMVQSSNPQNSKPKNRAKNQMPPDSLFHDIEAHFRYIDRFPKKEKITKEKSNIIFDYSERIREAGFSDHADWIWGTFLFKAGKPDSALVTLKRVNNASLKYLNLSFGKVYQKKGEDSLMVKAYSKELSLKNGAAHLAAPPLIAHLNSKKDYLQIAKLISEYNLKKHVDYALQKKAFYMTGNIIGYYHVVIERLTKSINIIGFIAAFLILIVWINFIFKLSFFDGINWPISIGILVFGMCTSLLTFLFSDTLRFVFGLWGHFENSWDLFLYSVFGIGAVEELVKIIPLLVLMMVNKKPLKPYHYIMYASISALGFAFMENLLYFDGNYGTIIHARALTAAVGHMIDSSIFAYGFVIAKYKRTKLNTVSAFFLFWLLASIAHGLYDYWLFEKLILFFILFFFLISRVWVTIINNSLNNSPDFKYSKSFKTSNLQFYLAFSLTAILMLEYSTVAFTLGVSEANDSLIGAAFSGSFLIVFLGSKLSSVNLVKGYWSTIKGYHVRLTMKGK